MRSIFLASCIIGLLLWSGCKKDDDKNELQAIFDWELTEDPGKVIFTNRSRNADIYEWNFGDGTFSTVTSPQKTYGQNGDFIVTLKAFGSGNIVSVSDTIMVDNIP
jgi:PKD repeat protein